MQPTGIDQGNHTGDGGSSTNTGAIAGGVVGVVVGVAAIGKLFCCLITLVRFHVTKNTFSTCNPSFLQALAGFFLYRRNRKQKQQAANIDPFAGVYPPPSSSHQPMSSHGTLSTGAGSNARPLVAPLRPVSKTAGEELDPYGPYLTPQAASSGGAGSAGGYYEETSPRHSTPSTGYYSQQQPYYTDQGYDGYGYYHDGGAPVPPLPTAANEGGINYGRHVPDLADDEPEHPPATTTSRR